MASIRVRRLVFLALAAVSIAGLLVLATRALSPGGLTAGDIALLVLFGLTTPWLAVGLWNSVIGLAIMLGARDPSAFLIPEAAQGNRPLTITASTAILMCVRNEGPDRVVRNLDSMIADLDTAGWAQRFHFYILSDTNRPDVAAAEQAAFEALARRWAGRLPVTYRRREVNTGFKAGNIRDFLERWGDGHDFMVTLDADSFMTGPGILRLVDVMQRRPQLGILQSLVIGMPTTSAFARLFQFGMRLGLRSWTIGSAWWQADCGPYWGHNAILRVAPFKARCALQPLPGKGILSGHILSHDQLEAALMRRAGYEVRVLPEEDLGWEENPPTLIEFLRRDQRWLQGTLQYAFFLGMPGLRLVSRIQLLFAMLMFTGSPAWVGMWLLGIALDVRLDPDWGLALLAVVGMMWFAPKIVTIVDVLAQKSLRRGFGGPPLFFASVAAETIFSLLLAPIMWVCHTTFFLGLAFGRVIGWGEQQRDDHAVSWSTALQRLWPQAAVGAACLLTVALSHPAALPFVFALFAGGPLLAVPLCVVTSWRSVGLALQRFGIARLPEETEPPAALTRRAGVIAPEAEPVAAN